MPCTGRRVIRAVVALDPERDDIDIDQHGEIGCHDLQEVLEIRGPQHRDDGLVHAALAREVAAARRNQALLLALQPHHVAAQTLQHEMLEIEHAVAGLAARRPHQPQGFGMPLEEIRMLAQIGDDVVSADLARLRR